MTLEQAIKTIEEHLGRMSERYGRVVFDEWALVAVFERRGRILHYSGARREELQATFADDIRHFTAELVSGRQPLGYFDFSRDSTGAQFDAFVVVGEGCYLVCNNTTQSIAGITKDPRWLQAQVPFAELSERFRSDPMIHIT
jgi:hypothetical protein